MPTVRKRGQRWNAQVRVKRDGVIVHQESSTFDTKQAAMLWGLGVEDRIEREGYQARSASFVTVADVMRTYEKSLVTAKKTGKGLFHSIGVVMFSPLAALRLPELTSTAIIDWCIKLSDQGLAPATVMHHLSMLRAALRSGGALMGVDMDSAVRAVEAAVEQLRRMRVALPSNRRDRRVSDAEIEQIIAEVEGNEVRTDLYIRLAVVFPRRLSELTKMRRRDISPDKKSVFLGRTKTPQGFRDEIVPLPPAALEIIERIDPIEGDDRILPYRKESIGAAFQRAVKRAGLVDVHLHDLRHEGISRLFEQELSIQEVALISGHTSWSTLRRYTHLKPNDVTEKLDARRKRTQETLDEPAAA